MTQGAYAAAYPRVDLRPHAFWGRAATAVEWITAAHARCSTTANPPFYRWFRGGSLNTCFNALDRHVRDGRGDQAAAHLRQPGHRHEAHLDVCRAARPGRHASPARSRRWGSRRATGSSSTCRWCPRRVVAMLACARSGRCTRSSSAASPRASWRRASRTPSRWSSWRRAAGSSRSRVVEYKPMLDAALDRSSHKPESVIVLQRRAGARCRRRARHRLGGAGLGRARGRRRAGRLRRGRGHRPALHPLHLRHDRPAQGHRARQRRPRRRAALVDGERLRHRPRRRVVHGDPTSAGSSGHSYIVYAPLLTGATTVLYEGKPVGTPDAGAFWRVIADHGVKAMFTAPTAYRAIKREDPDGTLHGGARPVLPARRCSWPASGSTPTPTSGPPTVLGVPVVDNWWQTETGWPIAANLRGLEPMPIKPGSPSVRGARATTCRCSTSTAQPVPAGHRGRDRHPAAAAPGHAAHPVAGRRALRRRLPVAPSRATTSPATAG